MSVSMTKYEIPYNKDLTSEEFKNGLDIIQHNIEQFAKDNNVDDKFAKDKGINNTLNQLRNICQKEYTSDETKVIKESIAEDGDKLITLQIGFSAEIKRISAISYLLCTLYNYVTIFAYINNLLKEFSASDISSNILNLYNKLKYYC